MSGDKENVCGWRLEPKGEVAIPCRWGDKVLIQGYGVRGANRHLNNPLEADV